MKYEKSYSGYWVLIGDQRIGYLRKMNDIGGGHSWQIYIIDENGKDAHKIPQEEETLADAKEAFAMCLWECATTTGRLKFSPRGIKCPTA